MDICSTVGSNIRALRKQLALSQEELAFRAGVDRAYLSQIENGKKNITITLLAQLAVELRVPPARLFDKIS